MNAHVRMSDSLLRNLGGRTVLLHIPAPAIEGDIGEQLGLAAPDFQNVELTPASLRRVRAKIAVGTNEQVAQYELLVSASAVEKAVGTLAYDSAAILFAQAAGVVVDGELFEIASFAAAEAFGVTYLYRLALSGAAKDLV
jgi:hypothetical protein